MSVSRREVMRRGAATGLVAGLPAPLVAAARRSIDMRPMAVVVDGEPHFLLMGSIDYFRIPHQLWRDRLLRAKRAGLNAVAFYVAWNFHERREREYLFDGDADLGRFIDLCGELGLFAFPRVGPFICDEWEGGGHPAWIVTKPDVELRTESSASLRYVARWFDRLMPVIAPRQVTRGGPVLMVQQENEYFFIDRPNVRTYQASLIRMMRERGIEVPITDCNGARAETRVPGSMATLNGGGAESVATLRRLQPDRPAIISELYTDYINMWGWPLTRYPTTEHVLHQTAETIAAGGMPAYFMFHGGTNFGFWASTSWKSDQSFVTTRFYSRAPVAEGGALNPSYFAVKSLNLPTANAAPFLTMSAPDTKPAASVEGPAKLQAWRGPRGTLLFVLPDRPEKVEQVFHTDGESGPLIQLGEDWPMSELAAAAGTLRLPDGRDLPLAEPASRPAMLPYALRVDPGRTIDHANATLLGVAGTERQRIILFRGAAGRRGVVSINGREVDFVFSDGAPVRIEIGDTTVLGVSLDAADHTWFADGRVLIGPAYVAEREGAGHRCALFGESQITTVSPSGVVATRTVAATAAPMADLSLGRWRARPFAEITGPTAGWTAMASPRSVETFGADQGYSWYRARVRSPIARETGLHFTAASDRLTVFVNGRRAGVWGRGAGAERDVLAISLAAGENEIVIMCDNMGRRSEGAVQDRKGIYGPAYLNAAFQPLPPTEERRVDALPSRSWRAQTYRHYYPDAPVRRVGMTLAADAGRGTALSFRWIPQYAWVIVDGRLVAEHAGDLALADGTAFNSFDLTPYLRREGSRVEIVYVGPSLSEVGEHVRLITYDRRAALGDWAFRPWRAPTDDGPVRDGDPAWWTTVFDAPRVPGPYFLATDGLTKGHAFLNGRALGRYWEIGPQHSLYLPEPWMQERNELAVFDEAGASPASTYLLRDARLPTETVIV